mmetsp:Transcript_28463/g.71492  ORF Transcript_28463/g.71492 Transcript_28463/m.71492 type:complete len:209 (+) Transcript_28463:2242-2868(+)
MRDTTTSSTGPYTPPIKCSSSTMTRSTACTGLRERQRRESTSQCSAVVTTMVPVRSSCMSAVASPVSITTGTPTRPNRSAQSTMRVRAMASMGAMYTHFLDPSSCSSMRRMANSAHTVLPLLVGDATSALLSVPKSVWCTCVWIALKNWKRSKRGRKWGAALSASFTGRGCRSSSSVWGGYFSGRMSWRNEMGRRVEDASQRSDTTVM